MSKVGKIIRRVLIGIGLIVVLFIGYGFWLLNKETATLNTYLEKQDYVKIVEIIKSKNPKPKYISKWLREKAEEGHVLLQFELAKSLVDTNPSEALQWLSIAHLGANLDSALCADKTSRSAPKALAMIYAQDFKEIIKQYPELTFEATEHALAWHKLHVNRPPPDWICRHGMDTVLGKGIILIPQNEWSRAREKMFEDVLKSHTRRKEQFLDKKNDT